MYTKDRRRCRRHRRSSKNLFFSRFLAARKKSSRTIPSRKNKNDFNLSFSNVLHQLSNFFFMSSATVVATAGCLLSLFAFSPFFLVRVYPRPRGVSGFRCRTPHCLSDIRVIRLCVEEKIGISSLSSTFCLRWLRLQILFITETR